MAMLTTIDNPYNPFTQYDDWYAWDTQQGYNTCALVARVAVASDGLTEAEEESLIEDAMNDIVKYDLVGLYILAQPNISYPVAVSKAPPA